jgi:hypothetical protein
MRSIFFALLFVLIGNTNFIIYSQASQTAIVGQSIDIQAPQYGSRYMLPSGLKLIKPNAQNKTSMAFGWKLGAQRHNISFSLNAHTTINHPRGGQLFDNGSLAAKLDSLLDALQSDPKALAYLRKLQFFALHELFNYIVSIYTTFNVTHVDTSAAYLQSESRYALNKKMSIIEQLLDLIQAQLHQTLNNYFPSLPAHLTTSTGSILMNHDYGADLNFLVENQETAFFEGDTSSNEAHKELAETQSRYLGIVRLYLDLFQEFTSLLHQKSPDSLDTSQFLAYAQKIAPRVQAHQATQSSRKVQDRNGNSSLLSEKIPQAIRELMGTKVAQARSYLPINPPLFFYDKNTLQAVALIPALAQSLPTRVQSVPLPDHLIKAAQQGTKAMDKAGNYLGYPIAYFAPSQAASKSDPANSLYVNIPTAATLYAQEVSTQPDWLNNPDGILKMTRACLGDFTQLIGMGILDPCVETTLAKALATANTPAGDWSACEQYLATIKQREQQFINNNNIRSTNTPAESKTAETVDQEQKDILEKFQNSTLVTAAPASQGGP